jgi:hypothetical protein
MSNHTFRCEQTGLSVQIALPEAATDRADSYEVMNCPACGRVHLLNKLTGKTLSDQKGKNAAPSRELGWRRSQPG